MTRDCIIYDLPFVTPADRARALRHVDGTPLEIAPAGVLPVGGFAWRPERVPEAFHLGNQDRLIAWLVELGARLRDEPGGWPTRDGLPLYECVRYAAMLALHQVEHRRWMLAHVVQARQPRRVIWVAAPRTHRDAALLAALIAAGPGEPPIVLELTPPAGSAWREAGTALRGEWGPRLRRIWDSAHGRLSASPTPLAPCDVLFDEHYPNNVKTTLPIAALLRADHGLTTGWLATRPSVARAVAKHHQPVARLDALATWGDWRRGQLTRAERAQFTAAVERLPADFWGERADLPAPGRLTAYRRWVTARLVDALDQAAWWTVAYGRALDRLRPRVLVSTSYSSIHGYSGALAARARGIRTVYVQHGLYPWGAVHTLFAQQTKCVWGEFERRLLTEHGHAAESIHVTGSPLYDDLSAATADADLPLPKDRPLRVVYFASHPRRYEHPDLERTSHLAVARAAVEHGRMELRVKLHPGDHSPIAQQVAAEFPGYRVQRHGDSRELTRWADLAVVVSSTTGNEACVLGKPLIVLNLEQIRLHVEFVRYGAALEVTEPDGLLPAIRQIEDDAATRHSLAAGRRRLVDDQLDGARGQATHRVARAIAAEVSERGATPQAAAPLEGAHP